MPTTFGNFIPINIRATSFASPRSLVLHQDSTLTFDEHQRGSEHGPGPSPLANLTALVGPEHSAISLAHKMFNGDMSDYVLRRYGISLTETTFRTSLTHALNHPGMPTGSLTIPYNRSISTSSAISGKTYIISVCSVLAFLVALYRRRSVSSRDSVTKYDRMIDLTYNLALRFFEISILNAIVSIFNYSVHACASCGTGLYRPSNILANTHYNLVYNSDPVCHSCVQNGDVIEVHRDGQHIWTVAGDQDDYNESRWVGIYSYDSDPMRVLTHKSLPGERIMSDPMIDQTLYFGVELEVERKSDCPADAPQRTAEEMGDFAILKSDGSLSNGFEIVSAPATLAYHLTADNGNSPWAKFTTGTARHYESYKTDTCGIHVHISRAAITPLTASKMMVFLNTPYNEEFLTKIAGRTTNNYCRTYAYSSFADIFSPERHDRIRRYQRFNFQNQHTLELRMFRGNVRLNGILRAVEFSHALVKFCEQASTRHLTDKYFLEWISNPINIKMYKNLKEFLGRLNLDVKFEKSKKKEIPDRIDKIGYSVIEHTPRQPGKNGIPNAAQPLRPSLNNILQMV